MQHKQSYLFTLKPDTDRCRWFKKTKPNLTNCGLSDTCCRDYGVDSRNFIYFNCIRWAHLSNRNTRGNDYHVATLHDAHAFQGLG